MQSPPVGVLPLFVATIKLSTLAAAVALELFPTVTQAVVFAAHRISEPVGGLLGANEVPASVTPDGTDIPVAE
jgi:hypothetical protein